MPASAEGSGGGGSVVLQENLDGVNCSVKDFLRRVGVEEDSLDLVCLTGVVGW
jgi:hypothetical protein